MCGVQPSRQHQGLFGFFHWIVQLCQRIAIEFLRFCKEAVLPGIGIGAIQYLDSSYPSCSRSDQRNAVGREAALAPCRLHDAYVHALARRLDEYGDDEATAGSHCCLPSGGVAGWWFGAVRPASLRA